MPTLYSYVVATDSGAAPNPFGKVCTLVICKPQIRRTAEPGDWIVGTGSARSPVGDTRRKVVYAMRVSTKMPMRAYDDLARQQLLIKVPGGDSPSPLSQVGDAIYDFSETSPRLRRGGPHCEENRERDLGGEYALLSEHFYYFGARPKPLPEHLHPIVKKGQGHRSSANDDYVEDFIEWIEGLSEEPNRIHAKPANKPAELEDPSGFEEALDRIVEPGPPKNTSGTEAFSDAGGDPSREVSPGPGGDRSSTDVSADDLDRLRGRSDHPNARTAAYICGKVLRDQVDDLSHNALVTSANLASLLAWDRGVDLSDLDLVQFNVFRSGSGPPYLEIERGADSVSVPVTDRSFSLEEPWGGFYRISKVVQGTREVEPGTDEASSGEASARRQDSTEEPVPMESVWQNWKNGSSHCRGCPGQKALYPLGGLGDPNSDLMLVAKEPNYNVEENTVRRDMSWPEAKQAMEQDRRSPPNELWQQMRTVADAAGLNGPTDLYFTNPAKCNDKEDPGSPWEERYDHCRQYLSQELETVSPEVLLLYGRHAIDATFEEHGLDSPSRVRDVHARPRQAAGRTLVPLFHWAHAMREGRIDEYDQEVAEVVRNLF